MQLSFAKKLEFQKTDSIMVYRAQTHDGADFFCYVRCNADGYSRMHDDYASQTEGAASDYGDVIYRALMKNPDDRAKAFLANYLKSNSSQAA